MNNTDAHLVPVDAASVQAITRPDPQLWTLFIIYSVLSTVALPFVILPMYFRYKTLRYRFDDDGVSVSYGLIWRRETYLTYARIQDIHVTRNIFERWLGIGTVQVQTASGSASATESIVGVKAFQDVRNYLYARMRGHRGARAGVGGGTGAVDRALMPPAQGVSVHGISAQGVHAHSAHLQGVDAQGVLARGVHADEVNTQAAEALVGIRDELRAVRQLLEARSSEPRDV